MKRSQSEVQEFIVQYLSTKLDVSPERLEVDAPIMTTGISSREAVVLSGELEDFIGQPVEPSVAWEYPTIAALSQHLATLS